MNKDKLRQCVDYRVRLRPLPRRIWQGQEEPSIDDVWHVESVTPQGVVRLSNLRTQQFVSLGADHIHHFDSDPVSDIDGYTHGFFTLHVVLTFEDGQLHIEPATLDARRAAARPMPA